MIIHRKYLCVLAVTQNGTVHIIQRLCRRRKKERFNGRNEGHLF